jgi:hypothetical protein
VNNTVACRPIARQQPLLRIIRNIYVTRNNGLSVMRCSLRRPCHSYVMQQQKDCWERCFLCGPCRGYITRSSCDIQARAVTLKSISRVEAASNTSTVALRVGGDKKGSLESETVKHGRESHGTRTRESRASSNCKWHPSSRQRGCYIRTIITGVQLRKKF